MRRRLLRTAMILCLLIVAALLAANRYPDQLYHSWGVGERVGNGEQRRIPRAEGAKSHVYCAVFAGCPESAYTAAALQRLGRI
jgi:hypothetical protein